MLSLAKKKEFEAQSKPEFLPDDKLRPWVANPAAEEQIYTLVEDLEKMLALGSPVKEEHGASEIDRQIGTVDEDLLVDDEEPEPVDFPLPSQAFQSYLRRQERAKAASVDEGVPLNEDADVCQLLQELNGWGQQEEEAQQEEGGEDSGRGMAWADCLPLPLPTSRPLTHRRLAAIKKERMRAKEEVRAKQLRPPHPRAVPLSARVHFVKAQQKKMGVEVRQAPRRKRAGEGPHKGKGASAEQAMPRSHVKPFAEKTPGANLRPGSAAPASSLEKRPPSRQPSVATHRALEYAPAAAGVKEAGHTPQPASADTASQHARGVLSAPSSARRIMVGDMLRPPSAPSGPLLSPAVADRSSDVRSLAAACPPPLDRPLLSDRPSTAPLNGRHTLHQTHHITNNHSNNNNNGLDSARCPLPRPYANTSFAPRCLSSRGSSRPSSAATNGTIEVYDFAYRPWTPPSLTGNMARRPPSARPEEGDTYKRRGEALRNELVRYELSVLKTVDPRDLRNEMQAKGRVDNLWKVFTDPTINKQDLKGLMVSHNNTEHSFNEHFERELRLAKVLCPEYAMKQSKEAKWAENALANRINVFESGTWPKKPAR